MTYFIVLMNKQYPTTVGRKERENRENVRIVVAIASDDSE